MIAKSILISSDLNKASVSCERVDESMPTREVGLPSSGDNLSNDRLGSGCLTFIERSSLPYQGFALIP